MIPILESYVKAAFAIKELNIKYSDAVDCLSGDTSTAEVLTWTKQEQEARGWIANNNLPTPFIDAMLESRTDHTKESLVNKIIEKSDIYTSEVGRLLGEKQKQEKALLDSSVTKE